VRCEGLELIVGNLTQLSEKNEDDRKAIEDTMVCVYIYICVCVCVCANVCMTLSVYVVT